MGCRRALQGSQAARRTSFQLSGSSVEECHRLGHLPHRSDSPPAHHFVLPLCLLHFRGDRTAFLSLSRHHLAHPQPLPRQRRAVQLQ